jgi:hypothetical protein
MDVQVYKPRAKDASISVYRAEIRRFMAAQCAFAFFAYVGHESIFDEQCSMRVNALCRVNQSDIFY